MNMQRISVKVALGILVCLVPVGARAQGPTQNAQKDSKFDIFLGYSYANHHGSGGTSGLHGYDLRATWSLSHNLGLEADFAGHHGSTTPFTTTFPAPGNKSDLDRDKFTFLFGPRITHHADNFQFYTHFLVGGAHIHESTVQTAGGIFESEDSGKGTGFGFEGGGGVDWVSHCWGWRILEVDYVYTNVDSTVHFTTSGFTSSGTANLTGHTVQLTTGIFFRFGTR